MEQQQPEPLSGGGDGDSSRKPQQETAVSEEAGGSAAAAASADPAAATASYPRRSSAGSASSPTKSAAGGGAIGSAPSSPKRSSVSSSGGGGPPVSPGKRHSASSLASAPRVGAPLPPAPKPSSSGSQQNSPRKSSTKTEKAETAARTERRKSGSEPCAAAAMAESNADALSPQMVRAAAACEDASGHSSVRSALMPTLAADAVAAAASASTTGPTSPARGPPLAPRPLNGPAPPRQVPPPNPVSSAPSSVTGTPVPPAPRQVPPALSVGGTPNHLAPPLVTAASVVVGSYVPSSNPVSPSASMGGPSVPPAMPNLERPHQAPPAQDGVLLGVEALERQQAELEHRRLQAAAEAQQAAKAEAERQRAMAQAQHLEQLQKDAARTQAQEAQTLQGSQPAQQQRSRTQSLAVAQAPPLPPGGLPPRSASTPPQPPRTNEAGLQDDDTAPSSTCPPPPGSIGDGTPKLPRRTSSSSFSRFIKTPLKQLRQSSFSGEVGPVAPSSNKHGSDALVVPPKDVDGVLEVEGIWEEDEVKPLVYGYLRKLGRNGQWQKRWFETDGMHLTYYKSRKRSKVLASLDLCHVGNIQIDGTDSSGCTFNIQVADRPYYLRAASEPLCKHWVINLNRVKEARCQVGGFQLVEPHFHHGNGVGADGTVDRQRTESDECMAPRVVMVANRSRTRAMAPSETEDAMMEIMRQSEEKKTDEDDAAVAARRVRIDTVGEGGPDTAAGGVRPPTVASATPSFHGVGEPPAAGGAPAAQVVGAEGGGMPGGSLERTNSANSPRLIAQLPPVVLARWQKRRSTLTRLSLRLLKWARSMRVSTKCITGDGEVVMGSPVHPPGRPVGGEHYGAYGETGFSSQPGGTQDVTESDSSQRTPAVGGSRSFEGGHAEWIDKEKQRHIQTNRMHRGDADNDGVDDRGIQSATSGGSASAAQSAGTGDGYESEEETRELS